MSLKLMLLAVVIGILLFVILFMKTRIKEQEEMIPGAAFPNENEPVKAAEISDELKAKLMMLKESGQLIKAIKILRDHTGMDLKSAKEYVENL
ncbi:hypothetical protein A9Q68_04175 [Streptococcus bovimastitidis]|uniref:Ribosomal protein L7/L12 C-terminal domain-containing protein n=1 Tax=Streptococcus bovimastitidis TaxID=1856638 RepID=A0A1L8MPQ1_9STRE|nr:hypothetical protein [Streptococcus bovimastitidis]OJF72750.1 hypothetical protein A9Q68_04175 [Streptococcus bovimastitidis]